MRKCKVRRKLPRRREKWQLLTACQIRHIKQNLILPVNDQGSLMAPYPLQALAFDIYQHKRGFTNMARLITT